MIPNGVETVIIGADCGVDELIDLLFDQPGKWKLAVYSGVTVFGEIAHLVLGYIVLVLSKVIIKP